MVAVYSAFVGFVFEIPALSVDVILKDEKSPTKCMFSVQEKKCHNFNLINDNFKIVFPLKTPLFKSSFFVGLQEKYSDIVK